MTTTALATSRKRGKRKRQSGKLISAKAKAKRQGWSKWIKSEADERAVLAGYRFDQRRADHVCEFGPAFLRHTKGDWYGQPFELLPWQREQLLMPLFGWVLDSDEWKRTVRRYKRVYCQIPKKNGKSTLAAYVALYCLVADGPNVNGAHCYSASTDKEQASLVHGDAIAMVEASPKLSALLTCNTTAKNIYSRENNSFYRVLSSCPRRNEGYNASLIIIDEIHKLYGRELWDALRWAFASRAEPLLFGITTAGDDDQSVCYEQYEYARSITSGEHTDHAFLPLVFEAGPEDDPDKEQTWKKANPSLGHCLKLGDFRSDHAEAKQTRGLRDAWLQLRLNRWRTVGEAWLDVTMWQGDRNDCLDAELSEMPDDPAWGGLDLAFTTDLSALVLVFAGEDELYRVKSWFWLPEESAARFGDRVQYQAWQEDGWIKLTPGGEADFELILDDVAEICGQCDFRQLLYDPHFASHLTQRLETEHGIERIEFPQRATLFAEPCAMLERMIRSRSFRHDGNPVLTWCLGNTKVRTDDNGNMRPTKPKRGDHRRIDGTVSLVMALAGAMRAEGGPSYYDDNEVEFV